MAGQETMREVRRIFQVAADGNLSFEDLTKVPDPVKDALVASLMEAPPRHGRKTGPSIDEAPWAVRRLAAGPKKAKV